VLNSNEERRLGDPIRRRSLYVRVEHPTPQREADIIASRTPKAGADFHREMAGIALSFRNYSLEKPPSVSEMIDFANALRLLGADHVTAEHRDVLLPFLAKSEKDRRHLLLREGFKSLLDDGARFAEKLEGQSLLLAVPVFGWLLPFILGGVAIWMRAFWAGNLACKMRLEIRSH
jgi:MoxR-like ATPase